MEVVITTVVLIIIMLIGVHSLTSLRLANEHQMIKDELVRVVQFAKIQALKLGHSVYLSPLSPAETNWAKGISLNHINAHTKQIEQLYEWTWSHARWQLNWSGVSEDNKIVLTTDPNHMISNGRFHLADINHQYHSNLTLNRLGRIKVDE